MARFFSKLINKCEINTPDKSCDDKFYDSLRRLVAILFAIVFGVGLSALRDKYWGDTSFWVVILAYIAILLSWWGYHWGTIYGPPETNCLCYLIDVSLLFVYWYLINTSTPLVFVLLWYVTMFLLYYLWESVRSCKEDITGGQRFKIETARKANLLFFIVLACLVVCDIYKADIRQLVNFRFTFVFTHWEGLAIPVLLSLLIAYRIAIHNIYRPCEEKIPQKQEVPSMNNDVLLSKAKNVANNAKAHLSNYRVGAAILSDKGNIYVGCNVEFDNYSNTIHAEEAAISALVSSGETKIISIAVYTEAEEPQFPCGMCRQSLFELGGPHLKVIACNKTKSETILMSELLPRAFSL